MTIYSLSKFCFFLGDNRTVVVDDKFTRKCGLNVFLKGVFIMYIICLVVSLKKDLM